jgi:hypothetical protein
MARRRARPNPADAVPAAFGTAALFAAGGGAIGALTATPRGLAALGGAQAGLGVAALGGLLVAAVSKDMREAGLVTAGMGLAGLLAVGVVGAIYTNVTSAQPSTVGAPVAPPPPEVPAGPPPQLVAARAAETRIAA